jgi:hypothetical protein
MRVWIWLAIAAAALTTLTAEAGPRHVRPYVGFGYGYGSPFAFHSPFYSPWYGPQFGVGVQVGNRHPVQRVRTERREERALKLYIYPAAGQSEAQTAEDRYQCHAWGADQSGHDPTLGAGTREAAEGYTRAFTACMEGRSYVVK